MSITHLDLLQDAVNTFDREVTSWRYDPEEKVFVLRVSAVALAKLTACVTEATEVVPLLPRCVPVYQ